LRVEGRGGGRDGVAKKYSGKAETTLGVLSTLYIITGLPIHRGDHLIVKMKKSGAAVVLSAVIKYL